MAMGKRKQREKQEDLWIAHTELAAAPGHPFHQRLNQLLEAEGFDEFVEGRCAKFYAAKYGRPSLTPGIYFSSLLIGYFEGIGDERGIAWRLADSLAQRRFVGIGLDEYTPDHSTISRTRRLIDVDTHREVFAWVLGVLADRGLLKGTTDCDRRYHAGGQCGDALDCAARHGGELRGVSARAGEGFRHYDPDPGRAGTAGPQAQEAHVQQALEPPDRRASHDFC
jgi:transposase